MKQLLVIARNSCGWPNLTKLKNGQVLCTYFNAPSHGLIEGDLVCSISDKNGRNWKKLSVVAKKPKGGNRIHLAVGMAHNGDILCFSSGFFVKDEKIVGFSGHWLSRSRDRGKTWVSESNPVIPRGIESTIPFGRIIQFAPNLLAYSSYRLRRKDNRSETWMIVSENDGLTWTKKSRFGARDSNESTLCKLKSGQIIAASRTQSDHHVKLCELSKFGDRWRERGQLTLPMQHPADLTVLSDKCVLLTYGIRNRGMMGIGVRISIDAGKTWEAPWVIHQFGDLAKDIGYPSTVLLDKEGSLLTAFYTDFEPSIKKKPDSYRVLAKYWSLQDWLQPKIKLAIFDGKHLRL